MNCESAQSRLSPFLDREIPQEETRELEAHLSLCGSCSLELETLRRLGALMQGLPRSPLPEGFLGRLALRRQAQEKRRPDFSFQPRAWVFALTAVLAGVIAYETTRPTRRMGLPAQAPAPSALQGLSPQQTAPNLSRKAPAVEAPLPAPAGGLKAKGSPLSGPEKPPAYTNEQLRTLFQEESERMGLQTAGEQEEARPEPFLGERLGMPGTRQQAEASIRQLAAMRRAFEAASRKPKAVPIDGRTAQLLSEPPQSGVALEQEVKAQGSWSGQYSGGNEGTRTVGDSLSWESLWKGLAAGPAPQVDFKRQEVVAVFLGHRPTGGYSIEIVGVAPEESYLLVSYRETAPAQGKSPPQGPTSPYALRVIPKSGLPVRFQRIP